MCIYVYVYMYMYVYIYIYIYTCLVQQHDVRGGELRELQLLLGALVSFVSAARLMAGRFRRRGGRPRRISIIMLPKV